MVGYLDPASWASGAFVDSRTWGEPVASGGLVGGVRQSKAKRKPPLYPVGNLDLETWRKRGKRLEARIEQVQKKIQAKRDLTDAAPWERKEKLLKQIQRLNEELIKLLGQMDEVRKAMDEAEMAEAMAVYLAYRNLH